MKKDTNKTKVAISGTIEGLEKLINQYFYSTTFKITLLESSEYQISSLKGILTGFSVEFNKDKFYFYSLINR